MVDHNPEKDRKTGIKQGTGGVNYQKEVLCITRFSEMFVKNAVDWMTKSGYDDISNLLSCYAKLLQLTWYRKGELYHVHTGNHC